MAFVNIHNAAHVGEKLKKNTYEASVSYWDIVSNRIYEQMGQY